MSNDGSTLPPPDTTPSTQGATSGSEPKPWWKRWYTIVGAAIVVLLVIGAIAGGGDEDDESQTSETTTPVTEAPVETDAASETTEAPSETEPPQTTGAPTTDAPTTTAAPTTTVAPTTTLPPPFVIEGSGDSVQTIQIPGGGSAGIAAIGYSGGSNFSIWALDSGLEQTDLLVNTIGGYLGNVLVPDGTASLEIGASGAWRIEIKPIAAARQFDSAVTGAGDDVLIFLGDSAVADITHDGASNFSVWSYPLDGGADLLVNEIGPYTGSVRFPGPAVVEVGSEGNWTITLQ